MKSATSCASTLVAGCVALLLGACGDDDGTPKPDDASEAPSETADASALAASCEKQPDGKVCGANRHCVGQRCTINFCGDGIASFGEQCDDGNQLADDTCTPSCQATPGSCGDGNVDPKEECDDGNTVDDDYCTSRCLRQLCRNGVLDFNEECDDGNSNPNDGCNNSCKTIVCGNGQREESEECDDGNQVDDDACSNRCLSNTCSGNDRIDVGEVCSRSKMLEDGKEAPIPAGKTCASDCKSVIDDSACRECEVACRDYIYALDEGMPDLVSACYQSADPRVIVESATEKCAKVIQCVRQNGCDSWTADNGNQGIYGCYCGEDTPGSRVYGSARCLEAPRGPCMQPIHEATECMSGACVESRLTDSQYAVYAAFFLAQCQREKCPAQCRPAL